MQQRGVLGDHADVLAQRHLADLGNVLPVYADVAAVYVVQAQQQIHQSGFARARAADQANFLAATYVQIELLEQLLVFIGEIDIVVSHVGQTHLQGGRIGHIQHLAVFGQGVHAVLHRTDVFKQLCRLPHHPLRQTIQAQSHGRGSRHRAHGDQTVLPQIHTQHRG